MPAKLGTPIGMFRDATIIRYNQDGTVRVGLNEGQLYGSSNQFNASIPMAWSGPNGEFMGGWPMIGAAVVVSQGQGGQWYVVGYQRNNDIFDQSFISSDSTKMQALKRGRALMQTQNEQRIFVDPIIGVQAGDAAYFLHASPARKIISHNFESEHAFTEAGNRLTQVVKRDLIENANRNILNSTRDAQSYDDSLFTIGLDPTIKTTRTSKGDEVRNPALVESRELVTEFGVSYAFKTDFEESGAYIEGNTVNADPPVDKTNMRSNLLSLSLEHPNHLIETIKGTVVDSAGNIVDLNRVAIPIGRSEGLSLVRNPKKSEAFDKIRTAVRKSIAYHFEINSRKGGPATTPPDNPPDVNDTSDYARKRSRFSIDIDKEGQFKINVPASSEVGNVPLLTRYETYSNLLSREDDNIDPNSFVKNEERQDIFLESYAGSPAITLTPGGEKAEYGQAIDRISGAPIQLGTAFHNIAQAVQEFQESAGWVEAGSELCPFDSNHPLNTSNVQLPQIITDELVVTGPDANAGGRSGTISLDGFVSLNIGANTVDRQSIWIDTAGSVISRIGRDKQGVSYASSLDGDVLIQIGGPGIGNTFDTRFAEENDAYRNGKLDIRVLANGQLMVFRMDETGVHVISPGRMTFWSQQDMIFKSNGSFKVEAENIVMYAETAKRSIVRRPNSIG